MAALHRAVMRRVETVLLFLPLKPGGLLNSVVNFGLELKTLGFWRRRILVFLHRFDGKVARATVHLATNSRKKLGSEPGKPSESLACEVMVFS